MNIFFILVLMYYFKTDTGVLAQCGKPHRKLVNIFIYRNVEIFKVKIYHCMWNDGDNSYSDISDNCIKAHKEGHFYEYISGLRFSATDIRLNLKVFQALADPLGNTLTLANGVVCKYSMGYCYDQSTPKHGVYFAVVWETVPVPKKRCRKKLYQLFTGRLEMWSFDMVSTQYLFWNNPKMDQSFSLTLRRNGTCFGKPVYYPYNNGLLVSQHSMSRTFMKSENVTFFVLRSKKDTSEEIARDCSLRLSTSKIKPDSQIAAKDLEQTEYLRTLLLTLQDKIKNNTEMLQEAYGKFKDLTSAYNKIVMNLRKNNAELEKVVAGIKDYNDTILGLNYNITGLTKTIENLKDDMNVLKQNSVLDYSHMLYNNVSALLDSKIKEIGITKTTQNDKTIVEQDFKNCTSRIFDIKKETENFINYLKSIMQNISTDVQQTISDYTKHSKIVNQTLDDVFKRIEHIKGEKCTSDDQQELSNLQRKVADLNNIIQGNLSVLPEFEDLLKNGKDKIIENLENKVNSLTADLSKEIAQRNSLDSKIKGIENVINSSFNSCVGNLNTFENKFKKHKTDIDAYLANNYKDLLVFDKEVKEALKNDSKAKIYAEVWEEITPTLNKFKFNISQCFMSLNQMKSEVGSNLDTSKKYLHDNVYKLIDKYARQFSNLYNNLTDTTESSALINKDIENITTDLTNVNTIISNLKKTIDEDKSVKLCINKLEDLSKNLVTVNDVQSEFQKSNASERIQVYERLTNSMLEVAEQLIGKVDNCCIDRNIDCDDIVACKNFKCKSSSELLRILTNSQKMHTKLNISLQKDVLDINALKNYTDIQPYLNFDSIRKFLLNETIVKRYLADGVDVQNEMDLLVKVVRTIWPVLRYNLDVLTKNENVSSIPQTTASLDKQRDILEEYREENKLLNHALQEALEMIAIRDQTIKELKSKI